MIKINVEEVRELIEKYRQMHDLNPADIELYENGQRVEIPQNFIDAWKFIGLGFTGFIETEFYKTGWTESEDF